MKTDNVKIIFKSICKDYKRYSVIKRKENMDFNYKCFTYSFERTMNALSETSRDILNKSFFKVEYPFWWLEVYSSTTFYRYRKIAITAFVFIFICANASFKVSHNVIC